MRSIVQTCAILALAVVTLVSIGYIWRDYDLSKEQLLAAGPVWRQPGYVQGYLDGEAGVPRAFGPGKNGEVECKGDSAYTWLQVAYGPDSTAMVRYAWNSQLRCWEAPE